MKKTFAGITSGVTLGMLLLSSSAFAMEPLKPFSDVPSGSEYYDAISYLQTEGIVDGYADGTFKPYQTINRAEFTKIIVETSGYSPSTDPSGYDIYSLQGLTFTDLEDGAWYNPYLREAKKQGFIDGYPDGTFKPATEINFVEATKIIVTSTGGDFAGAGYPPEDWYHKYVNILDGNNGIPTTINSFDQKITRGEMAEMLYRLKTNETSKPSSSYDELAQPRGYITGNVGYPSEGIPADMEICADREDKVETYCTFTKVGTAYTLPVPAANYKVYALVGAQTAFYSEFVTCGLNVNCPSHEPIIVKVVNGKTTPNIDPTDWYNN
jgi:hypothetical protein